MADITAKIRLDGEAEFKRGMTEATKVTKSLDSQLKLAEETFKETGDAETYMKQKADLLQAKLESQKKAVDAAKTALEQCKKQGLDPNSAKVQEWKGKLAEAESGVLDLTREIKLHKSGLDKTGKAYADAGKDAEAMGGKLKDAGEKAGGMHDALDGINKGISWQNVNEAIGKISDALDTGVRKAVEFGKALWQMTSDSTAWADDLATRSQQLGIDPTTLQQWEYAARFVDTDVDAIIKARNKLKKGEGTDALNQALEELGVSATDAEGKLRNSYDVMWDVLGAMKDMDDEERDKTAMDIFGKSYADLIPLINAGREAWDDYAKRAPVVSEEDLAKLTSANDALEDLDATLDTTKKRLLASLAPALEKVAGALTDALGALNEYLDSEEGQEKMNAFSDAVVKLATNLFNIDWAAAIEGAGKALTAITDGLSWLADHKKVVLGVLAALAGAKIWLIIAQAGAGMGQLYSGLRNLLGLGGGGGGETGTVTNTATKGGGLFGWMKNAATTTGTAVADMAGLNSVGIPALIAPILGTIGGMASVMSLAAIYKNFQRDTSYGYDRNRLGEYGDPLTLITGVNGLLRATASQNSTADNGSQAMALRMFMANVVGQRGGNKFFDIFDLGDGRNMLEELIMAKGGGGDNMAAAALGQAISRLYGSKGTAGYDAFLEGLSEAEKAAVGTAMDAFAAQMNAGNAVDNSTLLNAMKEFFTKSGSYNPDTGTWTIPGFEQGANFGDGFGEGMDSKAGEVANSAAGLGQSAEDALAEEIDAHSPSRVAAQYGEWFAQGYIGGILSALGGVGNAVGLLGTTSAAALSAAIGGTLRGFTVTRGAQGQAVQDGQQLQQNTATVQIAAKVPGIRFLQQFAQPLGQIGALGGAWPQQAGVVRPGTVETVGQACVAACKLL